MVVVAVAGYSSSIREGTRASESGHAATWVPFQSIVAAILHNAGSLLVVFNSARLVRQGEELEVIPAPEKTPAAPTELKPQLA